MPHEERTYFEILSDCCSESTAHGIPYVFKREQIVLKIAWLLCTMASAGVCGWLVGNTIMDYYDYETVTKSKIVFETPTLFPTVSLCSLNMFTTQEAYDFVRNYTQNEKIVKNLSNSFFADFDFEKYGMGVYLLDERFTDETRKKMGLQMHDMLLVCYFNNMECFDTDFFWYFDPFYGSCFSFNIGKNSSGHTVSSRVSTKAGFMFGLQLELFIDNPLDPNSMAFVNGLRVLVHNKTERPNYLLGVNANVGEHTVIQVSRTFSSRLEQPYSECIEDIASLADQSLYVKTILDSNYTYKQSDCFNVCLQKFVMSDCDCYAADFPFWNTSNAQPCRSGNQTKCYTNTMSYFFAGDLSKMCGNMCPLECDSITYLATASSVVYPSDAFAAQMVHNPDLQAKFNGRSDMTADELRAKLLSINVYYTSLSYQSFTEIEKTSVADLVSNIGGTMGLFLGVSFLSLIEIFDFGFFILLKLYSSLQGIKPTVVNSISSNSMSSSTPTNDKSAGRLTAVRKQSNGNFLFGNRTINEKQSPKV